MGTKLLRLARCFVLAVQLQSGAACQSVMSE